MGGSPTWPTIKKEKEIPAGLIDSAAGISYNVGRQESYCIGLYRELVMKLCDETLSSWFLLGVSHYLLFL